MKPTALLLISILLPSMCFAQNKGVKINAPKGFSFVPQGSFKMGSNADTSKNTTIKIDAFWMSNEITNKEFREFTSYATQHPTDTLYWIDFANQNLPIIVWTKTIYKDVCQGIIDTMAMAKESEELHTRYKAYFTAKEFDNYPVVGITQEGAKFYCRWKTQMENIALRVKGQAYRADFRLPTEEEWQYAALATEGKSITNNELQPVNTGKENSYGLKHLHDNVAEWTFTSSAKDIVVGGSSWKSKDNTSLTQDMQSNTRSGTVGFRVVSSYLSIK